MDLRAGKAEKDGKPLVLTVREYDLLAHLLTHPNEIFSREKLMVEVWGSEYADPSTVTVYVRRLRGKIEVDPSEPKHLVTVWGRGYRWEQAAEKDQ